MNQTLLVVAEKLAVAAQQYYESGEYVKPFRSKDIADCVVNHSAAAGVAAMAAGVLPGIGSVVAVGISTGAIWRMYIKVCQVIGCAFGKNKLKAISSAILTNVITQLAGVYAIQVASTFIPGAGIVVSGIGVFATTYFAGLIFLNVLTNIFKVQRKDVEAMSEEELSKSIKEAISSIDKKAVIKEAKEIFTQMRKDGSLDEIGKTVDISEENEE